MEIPFKYRNGVACKDKWQPFSSKDWAQSKVLIFKPSK